MIRTHQLSALQQMAALRFRAVQSEMAALLAKETALRQNLDQLVHARRSQVEAQRADDDVALVAGADVRWHRWVDQRRGVINTELAQVLAQKAACHVRLQTAFGKDQAAQELLKRAMSADQQIAERRASY